MPRAGSRSIACAVLGSCLREMRGFAGICHFTKREWAVRYRHMATTTPPPPASFARRIVIDLSIMTAVGVFLALLGPFGSSAAPLSIRLVTWLAFAWIGYAVYNPISWLVERYSARLDLPKPLVFFLCVAIATVPMSVIVWVIGFLPNPPVWPTLEQALQSYFYVFLIGGGITGLFYLIGLRGSEETPVAEMPTQASASLAPSPLPRLTQRLPASLGSDVIALEMEDHYVRVHTALGSELVLMRLRDAIAELDGIEGRQVHRSWWVARGAVEDVVRDGRNVRLKLSRMIEAPVARAQVTELRDAGWI